MWYFTWILGLGFAVLLSVLNAMWLENETNRFNSYKEDTSQPTTEEESVDDVDNKQA